MLEIILGVVVGLALILIFISILNNKFQFAIIKIEEAENNIDALLHTKKDLLERTCPIIIKELKIEEFLPEVLNINPDALNHFEFNDLLRKNYNDLLKTIDENEKLLKSDSLNSILEELKKNEIELSGAVKFYNDAVIVFNSLAVSFPSNIVGFFRRYKKKSFYSDEKREMFEILKDR